MRRNNYLYYHILIYFISILLLVVTITSIISDKADITAYYLEEPASQLAVTPFGDVFKGSGTADDPYLIESAEDIASLRTFISEGRDSSGVYFAQTENIDLKNVPWEPIGTRNNPFEGVYDGYGHQIVNLSLTEDNSSFMGVWSGSIQNLHFVNSTLGGKKCAVIANASASAGTSVSMIINCIVSGVSVNPNLYDPSASGTASLVSNATGCSVVCNYTFDVDRNLDYCGILSDDPWVLYCADSRRLTNANFEVIQSENPVPEEITGTVLANLGNYFIQMVGEDGISGTYNLFCYDEQQGVIFTSERISVSIGDKKENFVKFCCSLLFYLVISSVIVLLAVAVSRYYKISKQKCIVYALLSAYAIIMLAAGILTRGKWIIPMLYDGTYYGEPKYFTDFSDCLLPGFDPYTRIDSPFASIYPPFISFIFGILSYFIPEKFITDTITARNSQMGNLVYLAWVVFEVILLYEAITAYKNGQKKEKVVFFALLCTTYPLIDCMERGNVVFLAGIMITVFLYNYRSESFWTRQLAFLALSVAAGIKIYPALLGLLLVKEKRFRDTANCLAIGIIVNLLPSIAFRTGFSSIAYMLVNAAKYVGDNQFIGGKIDLSHLIRLPGELLPLPSYLDPLQYINIIKASIIVLTVIIVFFSRMDDWKIYMLVVLGLILLSAFAPHYYILYAIAPFMMFLDKKQTNQALTTVYSILFVGIFMTFVSSTKYPLAAYAPTLRIWSMTVLAGTFLILFEIVLLVDGIASCIGRLRPAMRK